MKARMKYRENNGIANIMGIVLRKLNTEEYTVRIANGQQIFAITLMTINYGKNTGKKN